MDREIGVDRSPRPLGSIAFAVAAAFVFVVAKALANSTGAFAGVDAAALIAFWILATKLVVSMIRSIAARLTAARDRDWDLGWTVIAESGYALTPPASRPSDLRREVRLVAGLASMDKAS